MPPELRSAASVDHVSACQNLQLTHTLWVSRPKSYRSSQRVTGLHPLSMAGCKDTDPSDSGKVTFTKVCFTNSLVDATPPSH